MGNLLRYEGRKLRHSVAFYLLFGIGLLLIVFTMSLTKFFVKGPNGEPATSTAVTQALGGLGSGMFTIICGLLVSIFLCEDFTAGTIKNIYARGYTRAQVIVAKYLMSLFGALIIGIADVGVSFLLGWAYFGEIGTLDGRAWAVFLTMLLSMAAYHALFFFVAFSVRKTAGAVSINIVTPLVMDLVLMAVDSTLKQNWTISYFWIGGVLSNATSLGPDDKLYGGLAILAAYIAVFFVVNYFLNRKRDLN